MKFSILDIRGDSRYASGEKHDQLKQKSNCNSTIVCYAEFDPEIISIAVYKKQHTLLK